MSERDKLIFVSSNPNKAIEAERILGIPLVRASIVLPEIQAADVKDITRYKLEVARTNWLLEAAGGKGLAAIAYALNNRTAKAQCCVAYWDGSAGHIFCGECAGEVLVQPRGQESFGWDPWFQPHGSNKTFAEMTAEEKDQLSHRGRAYRQLAEHLKSESDTARSAGRS